MSGSLNSKTMLSKSESMRPPVMDNPLGVNLDVDSQLLRQINQEVVGPSTNVLFADGVAGSIQKLTSVSLGLLLPERNGTRLRPVGTIPVRSQAAHLDEES